VKLSDVADAIEQRLKIESIVIVFFILLLILLV
jgi:hypothetical protein